MTPCACVGSRPTSGGTDPMPGVMPAAETLPFVPSFSGRGVHFVSHREKRVCSLFVSRKLNWLYEIIHTKPATVDIFHIVTTNFCHSLLKKINTDKTESLFCSQLSFNVSGRGVQISCTLQRSVAGRTVPRGAAPPRDARRGVQLCPRSAVKCPAGSCPAGS